jgi:protein TonB
MRNFLFATAAILLSLLIHYLILLNLDKQMANKELKFPTDNKIKDSKKRGMTSVKYVKLAPKEKKQIKKADLSDIKNLKAQKNSRPKEIKKIQPKKPVVKKRNNLKNVKTVKIPKPTQPIDLKQLFIKKEDDKPKIKKEEKKIVQKQKEMSKEKKKIKRLDKRTQKYIKLYGEKYYAYSKEQQKFIKNNISEIGRITQRYLRYPRISARTKQSGTNVIEFRLHPNGDITDLRLVDSSYYTALDQNSINTIKIAYKDYPKPSETTWIRINIHYILY